jgi:hypothetical protein
VDSVSSANETRAVNSPEVKEPGDVQEEGAVPLLGSQIATGPRKSPSEAESSACISARPQEIRQGQSRKAEMAGESRNGLNRASGGYVQQESGGSANAAVGGHFSPVWPACALLAVSLPRPCDAAGGEDDVCPVIGYSRFC